MKNLKYLLGPAPSVRLGRSLGVNVVPSKICSMNCLYCEAGVTKSLTAHRREYFPPEEIVEEFKNNFHLFKDITDVITVTGAGEPTLNSGLDYIVNGIKAHSLGKPVAILTNSTMLHHKEVFDSLLKFDIVVPSLDSALDESMRRVDGLHKSLSPAIIRDSLKKFCSCYKGRLFLEVLFCKGINDSKEDLEALAEYLKDVPLEKIQLGTVTRPPAHEGTQAVSEVFLDMAVDYLRLFSLPAERLKGFKSSGEGSLSALELKERVEALLKLRPCTAADMAGVFGVEQGKVVEVLNSLVSEKRVIIRNFGDTFYHHISVPLK